MSHRIRNTASVSTAKLMGIFACLSSLTHLSPNSKFFLLTDSLSSLHSLTDLYSTNPLVQRIHLTIYTLNSLAPNPRSLGSLVTSVSLNMMP